ncbi:hypothetical protein AB4Z22_10960 [Paenibacillus sp. TAF58]
MDEITSFLRFNDYYIEESIFRRNTNSKSKKMELKLNFEVKANISENKDRATIKITCFLFDENFNKGQAPFYIKCTIVGTFECSDDVNIENFELNAMAILLPYLRAFITTLTAQAGISPVKIPAINVFSYFNESSK